MVESMISSTQALFLCLLCDPSGWPLMVSGWISIATELSPAKARKRNLSHGKLVSPLLLFHRVSIGHVLTPAPITDAKERQTLIKPEICKPIPVKQQQQQQTVKNLVFEGWSPLRFNSALTVQKGHRHDVNENGYVPTKHYLCT